MNPAHEAMSAALARRQAGIVLLIAIVAVMGLAFAGMALVRAVATSVAIGDNVNARRQATYAATIALEHDVVALLESGALDPASNDVPHNYYASRQAGEDRRGVPRMLRSRSEYPPEASVIDAGDGWVVRHVIERLCTLPGAATAERCTLSPPSKEAASGAPPPGEPPRQPAYRVTLRVEGPGGATTYVQAMLSSVRPNPRLSWQVLDE
jgi:Tfp pilus assembly protein PilX